MTRAAIYVRRSTEEHQVESLETQLDGARRYAAAQGWAVEDRHVFVDSGVSRAEFVKRRGLGSLLAAAETRAFDVVIARDETRLGGDMLRTGLVIQNLADADVALVYYVNGERVRTDDATSRLVLAVKNFSSELEREKVSSRTRENLERKARRGLVAGGACYGYRVVESTEGKSWVIDEDQASVVRELFRRYAAGDGLRTIAKHLNANGIAPPRAGRRGTGSWSPSSVREMLRNERYRGELVWGRREKAYRKGTKVRLPRPEADWVTIRVPELRIVDDGLWNAVAERNAKRVRMTGSKAHGPKTKYLLVGIGRCAECGGPIGVANAKVSHENVRVYACMWHRERGETVCRNTLRRPVETVNAAVLATLADKVLREEYVVEALQEIRRRLASKTETTDLPELEKQARTLKTEIDRLTEALVVTTEKPHAVIRAISEREQRLATVEARINAIRTAPAVHDLEARRLEREARRRVVELRAQLFAEAPEGARKVLEALVAEPLQFSPEGRQYRIRGELALGALLAEEFHTGCVPSGDRAVWNARIPLDLAA